MANETERAAAKTLEAADTDPVAADMVRAEPVVLPLAAARPTATDIERMDAKIAEPELPRSLPFANETPRAAAATLPAPPA